MQEKNIDTSKVHTVEVDLLDNSMLSGALDKTLNYCGTVDILLMVLLGVEYVTRFWNLMMRR